ncbi:cation transport regulator ChaB [Sulfurifustis variabilis]|uniref:Cation transport regulator ChaB n=1 Tax=Sulfurifustis variabilis TaxID=1675686 RepID=A0A1C7AFH9_9GAMM|nr:ChaB family protein [Sulfurifustis variabilis]BAU50083.1 cation transport regulator ChaB [Sulfurifustis variabilis]
MRDIVEYPVSIPGTILRSDKHAQRLWKKAHDSAVRTYGEGGRAHRVAYAALKHEYRKSGDKWVPKGWKGPSDPQAAQGAGAKPKPTARGKVAGTEKEARRKAKEARSEYARDYRRRRSRASTKKSGRRKK